MLTEQQIIHCLQTARKTCPQHPFPPLALTVKPWPAAVLVPLLRVESGWHLLFIRRTENAHDPHSGQVAFPGGRQEAEDFSLEATALREAQEELGVNPPDVRVLGRLNDHLSITNFRVTPVVGALAWPCELRRRPQEVARWFTVPLSWLAEAGNHELRHRRIAGYEATIPVVYFKEFDGETLWGATAQITLELIETLDIQKRPSVSTQRR